MDSRYRILGKTVTSLIATAGTVNLGRCQSVDIQAVLDGNPSYEVAINPTDVATATCSKDNCYCVISDNGSTDPIPLPPGATTKYFAYKVYSGTSIGGTSANNKLTAMKLG